MAIRWRQTFRSGPAITSMSCYGSLKGSQLIERRRTQQQPRQRFDCPEEFIRLVLFWEIKLKKPAIAV